MELELTRPTATSDRVTCEISDPRGSKLEQQARDARQQGAFVPLEWRQFEIVYPGEFQGSGALVPGEYAVNWYEGALVRGDEANRFLEALIRTPLASDSFIVAASIPVAAEE